MAFCFDRAYFERKLASNHVLAALAPTPAVAAVHIDLIRFYEYVLTSDTTDMISGEDASLLPVRS